MKSESAIPRVPGSEAADVVIVGGGTAGALIASRLAERTGLSIAVVEAGPRYPWWALSVPLASYRLRGPWSWDHISVPQLALEGRRVRFPMGKVLGGSTAVNAMIAAHGPASDYDEWAASGCPGWSWSELMPCWLRATGGGRRCAVSVERPAYTAPFTDALVGACEEHGLTRVDALVGDRSETCGRFMLFQRGGRRYTTAECLAGAATGRGVAVALRAQVQRIMFDGDTAVGVEFGGVGACKAIRARVGVVLCAGVFGSPAVLMRSGIGPAERLRAAGISIRVDLPGVGENLHDHIGIPVVWECTSRSPGRKSRWIPSALEYALGRTGVMVSNGCEGGAFLGRAGKSPELEITANFQSGHHRHAVEMSAILMHPASRGVVTLDPRCPLGPPVIDPRFLSVDSDAAALGEGVGRIRDIASQPSLRAFGLTREFMPGTSDLMEHTRRHATTHYHPVGTCRMGMDALSVVSPRLDVRGLRNLWVCDNSIIPRLPAGHSAATAVIIAERGADLISEQLAA